MAYGVRTHVHVLLQCTSQCFITDFDIVSAQLYGSVTGDTAISDWLYGSVTFSAWLYGSVSASVWFVLLYCLPEETHRLVLICSFSLLCA